MAYRNEIEGSCLLGYCLVATLRVGEGKHLYDWQETQLASTGCKEYSTYGTRYLRAGLRPDGGAPNVEQTVILMGIMKHKRTIATRGIKPSQETHDTVVWSGPYKLGLWCTWNTLLLVHGWFQNLQGHNGLNHYTRLVTLNAIHKDKWNQWHTFQI